MRIGLVMSSLPQYSETFLNSKIKGLQESGFDVVVFTGPGRSPKAPFKHVPAYPSAGSAILRALMSILVVAFTLLRAPAPTLRFWKLKKREGAGVAGIMKSIYHNAHILPHRLDWVHYTFATFALGRESLARAVKARMSMSIRGFDIAIYPLKNPGCFKKTWRYLDKLHTISDDLLEKARHEGMPADMPFQKITPAINTGFFNTKPDLGSLSGPLRLLTVGRVHWKKGYEHTLAALRMLKDEGIDFRYRIIGTGPETERLKYATYALGLQDMISFEGELPHEEVTRRLSEADIYLQPSLQEGFCNSVLEAQLSGLLCIVSDAEGLSENVLHGVTGWVVPRRDPAALTDAIRQVVRMPDTERRAIALAAAERVKKEFTIESQNKAFADFYTS